MLIDLINAVVGVHFVLTANLLLFLLGRAPLSKGAFLNRKNQLFHALAKAHLIVGGTFHVGLVDLAGVAIVPAPEDSHWHARGPAKAHAENDSGRQEPSSANRPVETVVAELGVHHSKLPAAYLRLELAWISWDRPETGETTCGLDGPSPIIGDIIEEDDARFATGCSGQLYSLRSLYAVAEQPATGQEVGTVANAMVPHLHGVDTVVNDNGGVMATAIVRQTLDWLRDDHLCVPFLWEIAREL